jgi:ATP-dependent DNA helicase RecG
MCTTDECIDLWNDPISSIKGIGPARSELFEKLGITFVGDALDYVPRKYTDLRKLSTISQIEPEGFYAITGRIKSLRLSRRGRRNVLRGTITDDTGYVEAVWFNQGYYRAKLKTKDPIVFTGKVKLGPRETLQLVNPEFEILDQDNSTPQFTGRIVPVYGLTEGVHQRSVRNFTWDVIETRLDAVDDPLPEYIRERHGLMPLNEAYANIHFPGDDQQLVKARFRLKFQELFLLQLGVVLRRKSIRSKQKKQSYCGGPHFSKKFIDDLPFDLTRAQQTAVAEIESDLDGPFPMNRLLQGDVGSGKTVVAIWAMLRAVENGFQAAIMAPTEVLARQHYHKIVEMLEGSGVRTTFLAGGLSASKWAPLDEKISCGEAGIIVGTHAIFQQRVKFNNLGLIVVDEQHRFGVRQRLRLFGKAHNPDILVMTATPIPRTLAITMYGDMDISVIDEMPHNRLPIKTKLLKESALDKAWGLVRKEIAKGRQAYIIYPLVNESEKMELKAAVEMFEKLRSDEFSQLRLGLVHGAMAAVEKDRVMQEFKHGQLDALVATTVIEVGIDVPNATVIVIENAERFGLAQLHQLRGRVGRGRFQSHCLLVSNAKTALAKKRLKTIQTSCDGFKIAEIDLKLRGTGEFFGTRQSGMPELRVSDPVKDIKLMRIARSEAQELVDNPSVISDERRKKLRHELRRLYSRSFPLISA